MRVAALGRSTLADFGRLPMSERHKSRRYESLVCAEIRVAALVAEPVGHSSRDITLSMKVETIQSSITCGLLWP